LPHGRHLRTSTGTGTTTTTDTSTPTAPATSTAPSPTATPTATTTATTSAGHMKIGVNIAGGEFGQLGQAYGFGYIYPSHAEIDYYAAKGMDEIRVPFLWERVQSAQKGALDSAELARLDDVVNYATSKGLLVDLDMHNYGYGFGAQVGSAQTPTSSFSDFWGKFAGHYAGNGKVMFGLMNEPHDQSAAAWLPSVNDAIANIRGAGATSQTILVPGTYWDGAWTWVSSDNDTVIGQGVKDPNKNFAFEVHQYLDADGSGTSTSVASTTIGADRLKAVTDWATATHNKLFLGEFGAGSDPTSLAALDNMLNYMTQHQDVWQGATYWAGGPWWGNYMFSIEPQNGHDAAQMGVVAHYADILV
jgi:endoglucanase